MPSSSEKYVLLKKKIQRFPLSRFTVFELKRKDGNILNEYSLHLCYEKAGEILGTLDDRTIRKHILLGWRMIKKTNLRFHEFLATLYGYTQMPELKAGENAYTHLNLLVDEANQTAIRMGESVFEPTTIECYVHVVYVFEKCRKPIKTELNNALHALLFFDTS